MNDIFAVEDYREIIRNSVLRLKAVDKSYTFQSLATACKVTKTYLSRVLSGNAELNEDQIFRAANYLGFTNDEYDYLSSVHSIQRSVDRKRISALKKKITKIKNDVRRTERHLTTPTLAEDMTSYFLDPYCQLIHLFLTIDEYKIDVDKIKEKLKMDTKFFNEKLNILLKNGLVSAKDGRYEVIRESLHLPKDSTLFPAYRKLIRLNGLDHYDQFDEERKYSVSVLFSSSESVREKIEKEFLKFLSSIETKVKASPKEHVYQMHFDIFARD